MSKSDGSQSLDLQHDALRAAGVETDNIYDDRASGSRDDRLGLSACPKPLRDGDILIVWKLDRLGRTLTHLVSTVQNLSDRGIGLRVLTGRVRRSTPRRPRAAWYSASSPRWRSLSVI